MERRLLSFFVAAAVFVTVYFGLNSLFPQQVAPKQPPQQGTPTEIDPAVNLEKSDPSTDVADANGQLSQDTTVPAVSQSVPEWTTLGSMDPSEGYYLMVTLSSRGGAIERIELTERRDNGRLKYRRVDVQYGYLGYLAAAETAQPNGVVVRVVGPGTPAALATSLDGNSNGLQVNDRIVALDNQAIATVNDFESVLEKTKPGQKITVEVVRGTTPTNSDIAASLPLLKFEAELSEHPLDLIRLADTGGADQIRGNLDRLSCLLSLAQVGELGIRTGQREITKLPSQHAAVWTGARAEESEAMEYRLTIPEPTFARVGAPGNAVELVRRFTLPKESYVLDMGIDVINRSDKETKLGYRLEGPNELTLEGWWYSTKISPNFSGAAARDFVYNTVADYHNLISAYSLLKSAKKKPDDPDEVIFSPDGSEDRRQVRYIGVDAQYFVAAFVPSAGEETIDIFSRGAGVLVANAAQIPANQERAANVSFYVDSVVRTIAAGESLSHNVRLFAGPKQPDLLDTYGLTPTMEYGWFPWVAKPLSWLLHGFFAIVGNYAIAIIMLTLLVRGLMFPLSRRAAIHAQKMQELAPELKKIAEKHKDDLEKRLKAQRELQQRVGFNPLSGCLPMFVQLPIFIGLYRALSVDIELRQAALSSTTQWASNLAGPDKLYFWGDWLWDYLSGRGTGWLGPYFNILPILVVTLFLVQQKMFMPPATDEQTAMTQKVMTIMTMMMGLFFFRVPSGLCIYFITSSLWGIAERKLVKRMIPAKPQLALGGTIDGAVANVVSEASDRPSMTDRLRKAVGKEVAPPTPIVPPSKRKRPPGTKK